MNQKYFFVKYFKVAIKGYTRPGPTRHMLKVSIQRTRNIPREWVGTAEKEGKQERREENWSHTTTNFNKELSIGNCLLTCLPAQLKRWLYVVCVLKVPQAVKMDNYLKYLLQKSKISQR